MAGESDLVKLLSGMRPTLHPGQYVYTSVDGTQIPPGVSPVAMVSEEEGLTLVLRKEEADSLGMDYEYVAGWITLQVHSSLEGIGLTAAFSEVIGRAGISCNVVAGFYHDHLFVPYDRATSAVEVIENLARESRANLPGHVAGSEAESGVQDQQGRAVAGA